MIERQPILGTFIFIGGLLIIAYNKESARAYEKSRKGSRFGYSEYDYIFWRIVAVLLGCVMVDTRRIATHRPG